MRPYARGVPDSLATAFSAAYPELLRLARARLAREQTPISAQTLAHELFLDLQGRSDLSFPNRGAFLAYAARAMRSLLVDMARERLAAKRHAETLPLTLAELPADHSTPERLLAMHEALERLDRIDPRLARLAELRAVLGLEVSEIAGLMGLSEPTVKRDWQRIKAYLFEALP